MHDTWRLQLLFETFFDMVNIYRNESNV